MKVHETSRGEGQETLCCGLQPSLLPSGDLLTKHPEIVTCDGRDIRCPTCGGVPHEVTIRLEDPVFGICEVTSLMKFDRCGHVFRVRFGLDMKIRLEERVS